MSLYTRALVSGVSLYNSVIAISGVSLHNRTLVSGVSLRDRIMHCCKWCVAVQQCHCSSGVSLRNRALVSGVSLYNSVIAISDVSRYNSVVLAGGGKLHSARRMWVHTYTHAVHTNT